MRWQQAFTMLLVAGTIAFGIVTGVPPVEREEVDVWRPAVPADSVPSSIAEAERQGSRFPRSAEPAEFAQRFHGIVGAGTAERRCVEIGSANAARSGEIIGMSFRIYADYWRRGAPPKLSWAAGHDAPIRTPTQWMIRASRIDAPGESYMFVGDVVTYRWPAVMMFELMPVQWGRGTVIDFPSPGRWLLVVSVETDWGCFVLDLPNGEPEGS